MKFILFLILLLLACRVHADSAAAESPELSMDFSSSRVSAAMPPGEIAVDLRDRGGVGSVGSPEFTLNTQTFAPGSLYVLGPQTVVAGSETAFQVVWQSGGTQLDVTRSVGYRFLNTPPANTACGPGMFYAGDVESPTTVQVVFWYFFDTNGHSQESGIFPITITPRLRGTLGASRQHHPSGNVVSFHVSVTGNITTYGVEWDLDEDDQFDDATGNITPPQDYRSSPGTKTIKARITDGNLPPRVEQISVVINKPPVANQAIVAKPAVDPQGFDLYLPDGIYGPDKILLTSPSSFVFNAGELPRKESGLVVIVHGLRSDGSAQWLTDMGQAIERRCEHEGVTPPNIALMDWSQDAKDPAPLDKAIYVAKMTSAIGWALRKNPALAAVDFASPFVADFVADFPAVRGLGLLKGQHLANWIYDNSRAYGEQRINVDKPLHLIGHSAGGFVVGEAARLLKHPGIQQGTSQRTPIHVDRVTLLDTPFPERSHLVLDTIAYPLPGTVERFNSSFWGNLDFPDTRKLAQHTYYRQRDVRKSSWPSDFLDFLDDGHGFACTWYRVNTIGPLPLENADGFNLSPIINPATRIPKPFTPPQASPMSVPLEDEPQSSSSPPTDPDIVPTGWETFGNTSESSGTWTFTESADAGIWKDLTLPQTASKLAFEFHFLTAGDGDFLAVHFGDNPVLYQGLDLPLSRDAWLPAEIPLDLLPSLDGKLVFTLVSRGGVNAQVQVRNIRIMQSEDPDYDDLNMDQETLTGSDPRNPDTDGDGISDGDEINVYGTDPLYADSDGDGQSDPSELAAGTDPLQNGSYLRVVSVTETAQGFDLQWTGVIGKSYRVIRSQELGTANYDTLSFDVPGSAPFTSFTDPNPPPNKAFYWVEVE